MTACNRDASIHVICKYAATTTIQRYANLHVMYYTYICTYMNSIYNMINNYNNQHTAAIIGYLPLNTAFLHYFRTEQ